MSIHDETWDRPICEHCKKEVGYGKISFHKRKECLAPKPKIFKLNLKWEEDSNDNFYTTIWNGEQLFIIDNGEAYYNVEHYDYKGNETGGIGGGDTIEYAMKAAENWVDKQLKEFMKQV